MMKTALMALIPVTFGVPALLASPLNATISLDATGQGSCQKAAYGFPTSCNNTDTANLASPFAWTYQAWEDNNWFAFDIPKTETTAATIEFALGSSFLSKFSQNQVYSIYEVSEISFGGITSGPSLGSIFLGDINSSKGSFSIELNAAGLEALNKSAGERLVLGGDLSPSPYYTFLFDNLTGQSAARLVVTSTGAVPEPATWLMLMIGLFGIGGAMRQQRANQRDYASYS